MVADTEVEITGGKHEGRIEDCKEKIESTNILSFYYTCGDYCSHTGYGFSFTCKLEDNKLHITSNGGNYNKRDGSLFRLNYSTDDLDFLNRLNDLIVKYQLSLNNGSTTHVDGLPAGIGDNIHVEYDSGEKIYKYSNQEPTISNEARVAIYDIFHELAISNGYDFNSKKSNVILYDDATVEFLQGSWKGTHFGDTILVEFIDNNIKIFVNDKLSDDTKYIICEGSIKEETNKEFSGISSIRKKNEILLTAYFVGNSYSTCDLLKQK